jgi:hypothetical protein
LIHFCDDDPVAGAVLGVSVTTFSGLALINSRSFQYVLHCHCERKIAPMLCLANIGRQYIQKCKNPLEARLPASEKGTELAGQSSNVKELSELSET